MFAIVDIKGSQERAEKGSILTVPLMAENNTGDEIQLDKVLMYSDGKTTQVGTPILENIIVRARIIEHTRADKVTAFKKKRRTGYKRKIGHVQNLTKIEIISLELSAPSAESDETTSEE